MTFDLARSRGARRTAAAVLSTSLVAGAVAVTGVALAPAASAATACQSDCLTVQISRAIDGVSAQLTSTANARLSIEVRTTGGTRVAGWTSGGWTTQLAGYENPIPQDTVMRWVATATDMSGATWREVGYFSTGWRNASVTYSSVSVSEDSDTGAGELVGGANVVGCGAPKNLAPLSMTSTSSITAPWSHAVTGTTFACNGVGTSIVVQSAIADDDIDPMEAACAAPFVYTGFGYDDWAGQYSSTSCRDAASTSTSVASPVGPFSSGTQTAPWSASTPGTWNGNDVPLLYSVSGSLTVTQGFKALPLPAAPAPAVLSTAPVAAPKSGTAMVSWTKPDLGGIAIDHFQITRTSSEGTTSVNAASTSTALGLSGLTNGVTYAITVWAVDANGIGYAKGSTSTTPYATSSLTGFDTAAVVAKAGTTVVDADVAITGIGRSAKLQFLAPGAASWSTYATLTSGTGGIVPVSFPVKAGTVAWRLYVPAWMSYASVTSATRTTTAKTVIAGFATTTTTKSVGTIVKDGITVTPGNGRTVKVQYRKAGTSTWSTYATLKASSTGAVTVSLKAKSGTYYWRVTTAASSTYGTAATTASRAIKGV